VATYLENLVTTRDQVAANLAAITASPKPTYSIDGQSVSWESLFNSYTTQLAKLNELISNAEPFEVRSTGIC
jgi:hypothetical protein